MQTCCGEAFFNRDREVGHSGLKDGNGLKQVNPEKKKNILGLRRKLTFCSPEHTPRAERKWFQSKQINVLDGLSRCPDLNVVQNQE